jgi:formylglycine-generating enzyme required for sulfatase activity
MQARILFFVALAWVATSRTVKTSDAQPPKEVANSIGMKLVLIPKGTFTMGSPPSEQVGDLTREADEPQHEVTISKEYYLGIHEVTQSQYMRVMGENPSEFQGDRVAEHDPQTGQRVKEIDSSNHPVESISWRNAVEFCKRLSELPEEKKAGRVYRLPTEAEWEYACRAGSKTAFSFGESTRPTADLGEYAWFTRNSNEQSHPVGEKKPNAWGLYDMHGNVWEWCSNWYGEYPIGAVTDPVGPPEGTFRVQRGGSWFFEPARCRSACRIGLLSPSRYMHDLGFRVALSSPEIPQ